MGAPEDSSRDGRGRDPNLPFPDRRIGPPDRRRRLRPLGGSPGRRREDYLRAHRHLRCEECGAAFVAPFMWKRIVRGEGCLSCGGALEEVAGAPGN